MRQDGFGKRGKVGNRRHRCTIKQHNGSQDIHGRPTVEVNEDYDIIVQDWPVEIITTGGREIEVGTRLSAETTHIMHGGYEGGKNITSDMTATIGSVTYDILAAYDSDGDGREMRVEMKLER